MATQPETMPGQKIFEILDENNDGVITIEELSEALHRLGLAIPSDDLQQILSSSSSSVCDALDVDAFSQLLSSLDESENDEDDAADENLREAFRVFDENGDGFISAEELQCVLRCLNIEEGNEISNCRHMIVAVDLNCDGRVDFSEFKQMMMRRRMHC